MINDYGLKTFHYLVESGEIDYSISSGESVEIEIVLNGKFDVISYPEIKVGKGVDYIIKSGGVEKIVVVLTNNSKRKKSGRLEYIVRGLRIWT